MLVIHVLSALLIFGIGKRLTRQPWVGFFAALLFSLSPFAITFQRRVLLDNIMSFWMLLSWWALLVRPLTLRSVFLSAVAFGIAVLTKENAIFFAPVFIYGIYSWTEKQHRSFSLTGFIGIAVYCLTV
jgi:4-amino-4-deoxy-L-arabinose transferase-like glycosyltransferase